MGDFKKKIGQKYAITYLRDCYHPSQLLVAADIEVETPVLNNTVSCVLLTIPLVCVIIFTLKV